MNMKQNNTNSRIEVEHLCVEFSSGRHQTKAVQDVSLSVQKGRITALVGESGSGKSVTALTIMNLLPQTANVCQGKVIWEKQNLLSLSGKERKKLNGTVLAMIFQNPAAALDPLFSIGDQITEGILTHRRINKREAREEAVHYLQMMNLPEPDALMQKRPFELSGGMCQRVTIAMAMSLHPEFLIADEPTTALDVTVQKQILGEISRIRTEQNVGVLFITHDLGVVAEIADDVFVMRSGQIVESGDVYHIFEQPQHSYTKKLLNSVL